MPVGSTGRAATTRGSLLDAAREVFCASGFAEASIADVVAGAGASVGSLYHHFGGKAELYLALFEDYQQRQEARAAASLRHDNIVTVYDLHATVLHLLGLDHERLTYYHNGLERRLTDVHGEVVKAVLT